MVQIVPQSLAKLWNGWEVRVMVLSSHFLQIVLIILGSRRKYCTNPWVRIIIWLSYLSADSVATVALGMISNFEGDDQDQNSPHPNNQIMAFWTPFLLLHLDGPDTITAYSLEDNDLWLRHLLGLIIQVGGALYIFLTSWTLSMYSLSLLAIPMFVAGIIKYGERTWVLLSGSSEGFGKSAGVFKTVVDNKALVFDSENRHIQEGYLLYTNVIRNMYSNVKPHDEILTAIEYNLECFRVNQSPSSSPSNYLFKQMEIGLGFMYDVLYTKASVAYSYIGIIFRSINLVCCVSTFVVFCLAIDKQHYSTIDEALTYLLCSGAIVLELYAIIVLLSTDWALYWLNTGKLYQPLARFIYKAIISIRTKLICDKRWSESMAQFNLIDFCLKTKSPKSILRKLPGDIYEMYENYWYTTFEAVPIIMKQLIFEHVREPLVSSSYPKQVLTWRGNHALEMHGGIDWFGFTVVGPFEDSILCWHIATDLCYKRDIGKYQADHSNYSKLKVSKLISEYMMYILVMRPSLLSNLTRQFILEDTCKNLSKFLLEEKNNILEEKCDILVVYDKWLHSDPANKTFKPLGYWLGVAKLLVAHDKHDKWEMISATWIEMLCYAAGRCGWNQHAHQLRRGGELLTHVCLLMASFGCAPHLPSLEDMRTKRALDSQGHQGSHGFVV